MAKQVTAGRKQDRKGTARKRNPRAGATALLTRRQIAAALGCHIMTVTKWEREGMPIAERGSRGRASYYRELEVRAWLQRREELSKQPGAANPIQERARKEKAQAILAEQTWQIRMRDLLPREEVEKAWAAEVAAVKATLLAWYITLPDQLHRAATIEGVPGIERLLEQAVNDVLRELAASDTPNGGKATAA